MRMSEPKQCATPANETAETLELDNDALSSIAEIHLRQDRPGEAASIYRQLASAHRSRVDYAARAVYARALVLLGEGAYAEARQDLRQALALDPQLEDARSALEHMDTTRIRALTRK